MKYNYTFFDIFLAKGLLFSIIMRNFVVMNNSADFSIQLKGKRHSFNVPEVMGILNITPDSFYAGSRKQTESDIAQRARQIIEEGGSMIDVGAYSTRPGSTPVTTDEEMRRLRMALQIVRREVGDVVVSVDTFRADVARMTVEEFGADIINDVGAPVDDADACTERNLMWEFIAERNTPYIYMSRASETALIVEEFSHCICQLNALGATNIILDPGYGFGKTIEENYRVMARQGELLRLGQPLLVGTSRKRMIWQLLGTSADEALNGTTVTNVMALERGAHILRVHDVRAAVETVKIHNMMRSDER